MDCNQFILSQESYEFIVVSDEVGNPKISPDCQQPVGEKYAIWYFDRTKVPPLSIATYTYAAMPACYGFLDSTSLEASGIIKLQNQPTLSLKGQGVFVAIIDSGINYQDRAFRNSDGSSRIFSMWDQSAYAQTEEEQGSIRKPPQGYLYGTEYTNADINAALASENPMELVPETDTYGHGTFLASVACGGEDRIEDFIGAAPEAELLVVKLKEAKQSLKDFYFIPDAKVAYAETDVMAAISYVSEVAEREDRPLVICLGLGSNDGSHAGTSALCDYLNIVGMQRHRAIVVAAGNEANNRHHYFGQTNSVLNPHSVEINIESDMPGFYVELWAYAPDQMTVTVQSQTGEVEPKSIVHAGSQKYSFLFEGTSLTIDYRDAGRRRRDQLIFMRFTNAKKGIWTIHVYPQNIVNGSFHMWLPMNGMLSSDAYFLRPNPEVTITEPSDASVPITAGGYNAYNGALYLESGRGFSADGNIKPDFLAPAVEVQGKGMRDNYVTYTGTSVAAAITAGACAQILEWAVVRKNALGLNSVDIQNLLIRGATRSEELTYPTPERGYGTLDVYRAFETLR